MKNNELSRIHLKNEDTKFRLSGQSTGNKVIFKAGLN